MAWPTKIYLPGGKGLISGGKFVTNAEDCCCDQHLSTCQYCDVSPKHYRVTFSGVTSVNCWAALYNFQLKAPPTMLEGPLVLDPVGFCRWRCYLGTLSLVDYYGGSNCQGNYTIGPVVNGFQQPPYPVGFFERPYEIYLVLELYRSGAARLNVRWWNPAYNQFHDIVFDNPPNAWNYDVLVANGDSPGIGTTTCTETLSGTLRTPGVWERNPLENIYTATIWGGGTWTAVPLFT